MATSSCGGNTADEPSLPTDWGNASVFGDGNLLTYAFTLPADVLARLKATAVEEKFVEADLSITGRYFGVVGLRYKGNAGTLQPCFQGGQQVCPKVSFKVKLDHGDPAGQLEGVTRLNFHSMLDDPSQMRERLSAKLFADMGILAPRVSHAFLTINGERMGLFAVVEEIDGNFLTHRGQVGGGNLYKEAWPFDVNPEAYDPALETNLTMRNHQRMIAFARALRGATSVQAVSTALDRWASLDYLFRYLAVDQVINNYDGITAFYCDATGNSCSNHNFFWYESPSEDRFWLIPWDTGVSFALHTPFDKVPAWNRPPPNCGQRLIVEDTTVVMAPACDLLFQGLQAAGRPAWVKALDRLLQVWDVAALERTLDGWSAQVQVATRLDPFGPGPAGFAGGLRALKRDLETFRQRLIALRDDAQVVPFALEAPGLTDFEGVSGLSFQLGAVCEGNLRSGAVHDLDVSMPINGRTDLRFDFEFANEHEDTRGAYSQWVQLRLPLAAPTPLGDLQQVRLQARADSIRNVRVELDSTAYGPESDDARFGWDVTLGRMNTSYVLPRGELALPAGARAGGPGLGEVLEGLRGLIITPEPRGRDGQGFYPAGKTDPGFLRIDDILID